MDWSAPSGAGRALVLPAALGTSPWAPGAPLARPLYPLITLTQRPALCAGLGTTMAAGLVAPVVDARAVDLGWQHCRLRLAYPFLRTIMRGWLAQGVRGTALVTWAPPVTARFGSRPRRYGRILRGATGLLWTARVMGALWVAPPLHPHNSWRASPLQWLDAYRYWYDPWCSFDSGLVLDVRALAVVGLPIPLPEPMAAELRPYVRCLCLADVPTTAQERALGWVPASRPWLGDAPFVPGRSPRYSVARWQAFVAQFPDVPLWVPGARTLDDVPPWIAELCPRPPVVRVR